MRFIAGIFILALSILPLPSQATAADFSGKATVVDGNTLSFGETKVSLWALNAPSQKEQCLSTRGKIFPCGKTANRTLTMLIQGRSIECDIKDGAKDKQSRPLVICRLMGMDINEQMVLSGWAVAKADEGEQYSRSQYAAKKTRSGMWRSLSFKPEDIRGRK